MKGTFHVRAQRGTHDGISVEDQASEVSGDPFDYLARLDHVGLGVNVLVKDEHPTRHGE